MSDIYHITRERVVDNYGTRSIGESVRTFMFELNIEKYQFLNEVGIFLLLRKNRFI